MAEDGARMERSGKALSAKDVDLVLGREVSGLTWSDMGWKDHCGFCVEEDSGGPREAGRAAWS